MNLNHSRIILITHRKFHQNQSSRLGAVHTHSHGHKKYIYIKIYISDFLINYQFQFKNGHSQNLINIFQREGESKFFGERGKLRSTIINYC